MAESQLTLNALRSPGPPAALSRQKTRMDGAEDEPVDPNGAAFLTLCGRAEAVDPKNGPAPPDVCQDAADGTSATTPARSGISASWSGAPADTAAALAADGGDPSTGTATSVISGQWDGDTEATATTLSSLEATDASAAKDGMIDGSVDEPDAAAMASKSTPVAADTPPENPPDANLQTPPAGFGDAPQPRKPSTGSGATGHRTRDKEALADETRGAAVQSPGNDDKAMPLPDATSSAAGGHHDGTPPAWSQVLSASQGNPAGQTPDVLAGDGANGQGDLRPHTPSTAHHDQIVARSIAHQLSASLHHVHGRSVEITLSPDELGRVTISLHSDRDRLNVVLTAERPETLDLMRGNIDQLAQEFGDLGYADLSFAFAGSGGGNRSDPEAVHPDPDDGQTARPADIRTAAQPAQVSAGRLDLRL